MPSVSIILPLLHKNPEETMADYKNVGLDPVGAPHVYEKQEVGKPSRNAAQPCAVYDDPYRGDELRDGWAFRVGTWNVDSMTGRLGELVEALAERRMDVLCVQETRWRSDCRLFGAIGKKYKLFLMGNEAKTDGMMETAQAICGMTKGPPRHKETWWWNEEGRHKQHKAMLRSGWVSPPPVFRRHVGRPRGLAQHSYSPPLFLLDFCGARGG